VGNFYVNHTVRAPQSRVVEALRAAGRAAFVSPTFGDYSVVFDEGSDRQDAEEIVGLGRRLSAGLSTPVLAVLNHDDSVLYYWLFDGGEVVEEYCSNPDYFDEEEPPEADLGALLAAFQAAMDSLRGEAPEVEKPAGDAPALAGGSGESLCRVLGVPAATRRVRSILAGRKDLFAISLHHKLVTALGLPDCAVGGGYRYIAEGDGPDGLDGEQVERVESASR
jgi:hypothetical protein